MKVDTFVCMERSCEQENPAQYSILNILIYVTVAGIIIHNVYNGYKLKSHFNFHL